jgi:hypothetical protein
VNEPRAQPLAPLRGHLSSALRTAARELLTMVFVILKQNVDDWDIEDQRDNQKLRDFQHTAYICIGMGSLSVLTVIESHALQHDFLLKLGPWSRSSYRSSSHRS